MSKKIKRARVHSKRITKTTRAMIMSAKIGRPLKRRSYRMHVSFGTLERTPIEPSYLENAVDSSTAVEDTEDLTGLTASVKRERQVEKVIEREL
jgi:hypothetical protein